MKDRIEFLDGFRGLAILLVIGFHAFTRWPDIVPYGSQYATIPLFKVGYLGVQLFFLISGFVILMTMEKCRSRGEFLLRRWLRLFPAMLIASVLVFLTSSYFSERPAGSPIWLDFLPGLTFIEPDWWSGVLGVPVSSMEGAFWSLYVEFKFYIFSALIYFWAGKRALVFALFLVFACCIAVGRLHGDFGGLGWSQINDVMLAMSFQHFGWFAAGAAFYIFYAEKNKQWLYLGFVMAVISCFFVKDLNLKSALAAGAVTMLFTTALVYQPLQKLLQARVLLFFGTVSYPLYLIHENMMIAMIIKLGKLETGMPLYLLPLMPIALLSLVAYLIAIYGEPFAKRLIVYCLNKAGLAKKQSA